MLNPSKSAGLRAQFLAQLSISRKQQQSITKLKEENDALVAENSKLKDLLKKSIYSPDSARFDSASKITLDNSSISR